MTGWKKNRNLSVFTVHANYYLNDSVSNVYLQDVVCGFPCSFFVCKIVKIIHSISINGSYRNVLVFVSPSVVSKSLWPHRL